MPSNKADSVAVIHTWPRPSSRANSAARRLGSRWAATSSSSRIGGSPRRSATSSAWARTRPSRSAFCSPVELRAAGMSLTRWVTARSWRWGPSERPTRSRVARAVGARARARDRRRPSPRAQGRRGRIRRPERLPGARRARRRCARGLRPAARHARPFAARARPASRHRDRPRRAACCGPASPLRSARCGGRGRLEREHQPVEEAAALAGRAGEQPVHRRGHPQHGQPFAERVDRGRRAVDPHLAPLGRARRACRCRCRSSPTRAATAKAPSPPCRAMSVSAAPRRPRPGASSDTASSTLVLPAPFSPLSRTKPGPARSAPRHRNGNRSGRGG